MLSHNNLKLIDTKDKVESVLWITLISGRVSCKILQEFRENFVQYFFAKNLKSAPAQSPKPSTVQLRLTFKMNFSHAVNIQSIFKNKTKLNLVLRCL